MKHEFAVATKIAGYGADKMDNAGYAYEPFTNGAPIWYVNKPATDTTEAACYFTSVQASEDGEVFTSCNCPFHKENGVCKHTVRIARLIEENAQVDEAAERAELQAAAVGAGKWDTTYGDPFIAKAYASRADRIEELLYR